MAIDFSSKSFPFVKESLRTALRQCYPDEPLNGLKLSSLVKAVNEFAQRMIDEKDCQYEVSRKSIELSYADLKRLAIVTPYVKVIGFVKNRVPTIYFYPRSHPHVLANEELFNVSRKVFQVKTVAQTYRIVNLTQCKLQKAIQGQFLSHFDHMIKFSQRNQDVDALIQIYHALKIFHEPTSQPFDKFYFFTEGVGTDLNTMKRTILLKGKKDITKKMIQWSHGMIEAVMELHKKKIYHGWVSLSSFQLKSSSGKIKVSLLPSGYTFSLKSKKDQVLSHGKPPLLVGYEAIKEMIKRQDDQRSIEGFSGDVWALGCTLHHWFLGDYPAFAYFASVAPQLNAACALLKTKIQDRLDQKMAIKSRNELMRVSSLTLQVSLQDLREDWDRTVEEEEEERGDLVKKSTLDEIILKAHSILAEMKSEEGDDSPDSGHLKVPETDRHYLQHRVSFDLSDSFTDDLETMGNLIQEAHSALARIELEEIGTQMETGHLRQVKRLHEIVTKMSSGVHAVLLRGDLEVNLLRHPQQRTHYETICKQAISFNALYLKELEHAEQKMADMQASSDSLIWLLQRMLHPHPEKRITSNKAFAYLKKHYPQAV